MKTGKILLSAFIGIQLFSACSSSEDKKQTILPSANDTIPVKIFRLEQTSFAAPVNTSGQFTTDDETILSFKTGGIVQNVLVREGDYVRKGQLLASLDITEIKANVDQALIGFEKAKRDYLRATKLYTDSVATLEQMQNSQSALDLAEQQLKAAKFNLANSEIRAVKDGYILRKFVNTGSVIGPGMPVLQTNGAGNGNWMLKVALSDRDWGRVAVNDRALIQADAVGDQWLEAYVSHKMEGADPYTGSFIVELKLKGKIPSGLAAGLYGKAQIFPKKVGSAWSVPYEAVLDANADKGFVFVTKDQKTAVKQEVKIAGVDKNAILISGGLEDDSLLITGGSAYLKDGSVIKIVR